MPKNNPILSIVILSYNTKELLNNCLESVYGAKSETFYEVIVSDNGSSDGSVELVKEKYPNACLIENKENLGFAAGNNRAKNYCSGKYILFLNSDTELHKNTIKETLSYIEKHKRVGALTCRIVLPSGELDKDARRSFPTPWVGFTHFSGLDRLFPKSRIFAKYWYGYISENKTHEVDVIQGAFFLARKHVLDDVKWFDEDYFLDGEDIDLCWKIKEAGWKIVYYPKASLKHVKKASKNKRSNNDRDKFVVAGVDSMKMFYRKHLWNRYPAIVNYVVLVGINIVLFLRKAKLSLD